MKVFRSKKVMKTLLFQLILVGVAASVFCGCATPSNNAATTTDRTVRDAPARARPDTESRGIVVRAAWFGTGTGTVNVTARVIELLRSEPQGFSGRADWLRIDPAPYRNKALVIIYDYHGAPHTLIATKERITYKLLIDNAIQ